MINRVKIVNFKSFKDTEVFLNKFNVLLGANAAGKSNFIQVFKFIRDIRENGLENAISLQGGSEYFRNINIDSDEPFKIELDQTPTYTDFQAHFPPSVYMDIKKIKYCLEINFYTTKEGYKNFTERHQIIGKIFREKRIRQSVKESGERPNFIEYDGEYSFTTINQNGKLEFNNDFPKDLKKDEYDWFENFFDKQSGNKLLIGSSNIFYPILKGSNITNCYVYDFDPKLPKKAALLSGKADLEEDGSNLSIVLRNLIKDKSSKRILYQLLNDLLPYTIGIDVDKFADKSYMFKMQETISGKKYLPAAFLSDGTIGITALIIALYFDKKNGLSIIEEPERNLHPALISKIVKMMKDVSNNKQILVTTHNIEMVKNAGNENLLLISRDKDGFSNISKPVNSATVKEFLNSELGIEDLFLQNLL